jgi:hydroxymethylbilane synthase
MHIKIGTRASKLALWQAYHIQEKLKNKGVTSEIVEIITKGDKILDRSLSKIGSKGLFTEELENQLFEGKIDIAVHSAKDLSADLGEHFEILSFSEREAAHDVFLSLEGKDLSKPWVVGTSSTRRVALIRKFFPHFKIVDMRGNLQTRIQKMKDGHCDILILAFAGVHRMGYEEMIIEHLDKEIFCPPVGQGVLAVEINKSLAFATKSVLNAILNDKKAEKCMLVERAFLKYLKGGCSIPVFGHAIWYNENIHFTAGIVRLDGSEMVKMSFVSENETEEELGQKAGKAILAAGGDKILEEIRNTIL